MTAQQRQEERDSIDRGIRGPENDYSLAAIEKRIAKLKKKVDDPGTSDADKEQHRKDLTKLHKDWSDKHDAIMKRVKQLAGEGGDLLSHLMSVLASQMTSWRNNMHRGVLDYLWDPKGTYQIRSRTEKKDAEEGFERRKDRGKTTFGAAMTGVGMVTSTILGGVGLIGKTLGQGADYVGNSAREMGSKLVANAREDNPDNATLSYRAGKFLSGLAGRAAIGAGVLAHGVGLAPKVAGMTLSGAASTVDAVSDYSTGRREYLLGESTYLDAIGSTLDQSQEAANAAFSGIKPSQSVRSPMPVNHNEELDEELEERHAMHAIDEDERPSMSGPE
jgi:hypothetical protein